MLCLNRKPHSTLFICFFPLLSLLGRGIINAVILCIFNSITSALPLEVDVSVIGAHHVGALFILLLYVIVKVSRLLLECSWLIKRNCFICEIYIQSIMVAMFPDVGSLGFPIHYSKEVSCVRLRSFGEHPSTLYNGRFLSYV